MKFKLFLLILFLACLFFDSDQTIAADVIAVIVVIAVSAVSAAGHFG